MDSHFNDLYFFGEGHIQNNPRHLSIIGYEGERPVFVQFVTVASQTSTQTRVYRDQIHVAFFDWTAGTHLGLLTVGQRQIHMGQLVKSSGGMSVRRFSSPVDGLDFEWRRTPTYDYELYSPGNRRIATYSRVSYPTKWGVCHGLFRYTFTQQDALLLEALLALSLNRWIDVTGSM